MTLTMKTLIIQTKTDSFKIQAQAFDLSADTLTVTDHSQQRIAVFRDVVHACFEDVVTESPKAKSENKHK